MAALLAAWRASGLRASAAALVLVGGGPFRAPSSATGAVHCSAGHRPDEVRNFYAGSDVVVLPSVPTRDFLEPWGLVVNEAFHQGVPVIATTAVGAVAGGLVAPRAATASSSRRATPAALGRRAAAPARRSRPARPPRAPPRARTCAPLHRRTRGRPAMSARARGRRGSRPRAGGPLAWPRYHDSTDAQAAGRDAARDACCRSSPLRAAGLDAPTTTIITDCTDDGDAARRATTSPADLRSVRARRHLPSARRRATPTAPTCSGGAEPPGGGGGRRRRDRRRRTGGGAVRRGAAGGSTGAADHGLDAGRTPRRSPTPPRPASSRSRSAARASTPARPALRAGATPQRHPGHARRACSSCCRSPAAAAARIARPSATGIPALIAPLPAVRVGRRRARAGGAARRVAARSPTALHAASWPRHRRRRRVRARRRSRSSRRAASRARAHHRRRWSCWSPAAACSARPRWRAPAATPRIAPLYGGWALGAVRAARASSPRSRSSWSVRPSDSWLEANRTLRLPGRLRRRRRARAAAARPLVGAAGRRSRLAAVDRSARTRC